VSAYVTPEAVVLHIRRAGPGSRMLARGLDTLIQYAALIAFLLAYGAVSGGSLATAGVIVILFASVFVLFGYPALTEWLWRGRTLGKAAFHLRVLTKEGAPIGLRQAAIRSIFYLVDGMLLGPVIGVLFLVLTKDTVRLGDIVAGTMVVNEGSAAVQPTPAYFHVPTGCDAFVQALDITGLGSSEYELVRQFLLRSPSLTPAARWQLAVDVAQGVSAKMRVSPPAGMHPELFLQCVAAAVQLRSAY
jgi:uncharacterized RDD family membrane protein YckC